MADVSVYGAGPAGLMAAEVLATAGHRVTIHDHMPSPARKFLLAGRGGLNLTHSEPLETFLERYGDARGFLEPAIRAFPPDALVAWANGLGIETFVGSSGRVFPKQMKASPLLRAWLRRLDAQGVKLVPRSRWPGFDGRPALLAFGGASWPHLGSDATWLPAFAAQGITVHPFKPANSRFLVRWSDVFRQKFAGTPVKNVALTYAGKRVRGELMISQEGIEGGAIYALSKGLREKPGHPLVIDFRPDGRDPGPAPDEAARQGLALDLSAQGGGPVTCSHQPAAGNRNHAGCRRHQGHAIAARAPGRHCPGDLVGRRRGTRGRRSAFPAPQGARCLLRRRDAGLGSTHRRLSSAGLLLDCCHGCAPSCQYTGNALKFDR